MAKRFYKQVSVRSGDQYVILLDGRVLKTPGKQPLELIHEFQAHCVAAEWQAQVEDIKPETMPCTRLMNVACELTPSRRPELCKEFSSYCQTDLLCFHSTSPRDLAQRQAEIWQPILDWAASTHQIALGVTTSIKAIKQSAASLLAAANYADSLDNARLTLLLHFTASLGSGVLALAVMEGFLESGAAYSASRLDEIFQNERWGEDEEAALAAQNLGTELSALSKLIRD